MFLIFFSLSFCAAESQKNKFQASQIGGDDLSIHGIVFNEPKGTNVSIPATLSKMGKSFNVVELKDSAFQGSLAGSYSIPFSIQSIGRKCFSECKYLVYVNLSETSIEKLKERTFADCPKLELVDFPSSIITIGDGCFSNCVSLKKVSLLKTQIEKIEKNVFLGCVNLEEIELPQSLHYIGSKSFSNTNIKRISFTQNFETMAMCAFEDSKLEIIDLSKTMITVIENNTFSCCSKLEIVLLPKDLNQIRANAFYKTGLKSIDFSNTRLEDIQENAFSYSPYLMKVKLPQTIKTIGENVFVKCGFKEFSVVSSLQKVGKAFLSENDKLEILDLSKASLTMFPDDSFSGCSILSTISLPLHDISFGVRCFADTAIPFLSLTSNIKSLGKECFFRCTHLTIVSMNESSIHEMPEGCFRDCSLLSEFIFPPFPIEIPARCFEHCAFKELVFNNNIKAIGESAFWSSPNLEVVSFLETNITEISKYAFADCSSLKTVLLPASITKIGTSAFEKCPISLLCFFGEKSPEGNDLKARVVSVTKKYSSDNFCGLRVTKNLTRNALIPGMKPPFSFFWPSVAIGTVLLLVLAFVVYAKVIEKEEIAKGDFESLLAANDEAAE